MDAARPRNLLELRYPSLVHTHLYTPGSRLISEISRSFRKIFLRKIAFFQYSFLAAPSVFSHFLSSSVHVPEGGQDPAFTQVLAGAQVPLDFCPTESSLLVADFEVSLVQETVAPVDVYSVLVQVSFTCNPSPFLGWRS